MSQLLLIVYLWLDTGAMTCGLDFEFGTESNPADSETTRDNKTSSLITSDEGRWREKKSFGVFGVGSSFASKA